MNCPGCGKQLPENINIKMNYCLQCGYKLFDPGRKYLIEIQFTGPRDAENSVMMLYIDERQLYKFRIGDNICIAVDAGFHTLKFRYKIRTKEISMLVACGYVIKLYYNSLSGLLETSVNMVEDSSEGVDVETLAHRELTQPLIESDEAGSNFDLLSGTDEPEYEIKVTSGLSEGMLRLFSDRYEFTPWSSHKKEVVLYKRIVNVKKKMGAIDVQCAGNVHKVYSIPKDIYNEVLAFLTNRISESKMNS